MVKRRCMGKHRMLRHYDEAEGFPTANVYDQPLRRSSREKRLLFATFNVAQMDKQILNTADMSEVSERAYQHLRKVERFRNLSRGNSSHVFFLLSVVCIRMRWILTRSFCPRIVSPETALSSAAKIPRLWSPLAPVAPPSPPRASQNQPRVGVVICFCFGCWWFTTHVTSC